MIYQHLRTEKFKFIKKSWVWAVGGGYACSPRTTIGADRPRHVTPPRTGPNAASWLAEDHSHLPRAPLSSYSLVGYGSENVDPLIIGTILLLALAHLGPALGEDANHIIADCRAVTSEQSFKDMAEARECLGIIVGTRVGATLQSHILKTPPPFSFLTTSRAAKWSELSSTISTGSHQSSRQAPWIRMQTCSHISHTSLCEKHGPVVLKPAAASFDDGSIMLPFGGLVWAVHGPWASGRMEAGGAATALRGDPVRDVTVGPSDRSRQYCDPAAMCPQSAKSAVPRRLICLSLFDATF